VCPYAICRSLFIEGRMYQLLKSASSPCFHRLFINIVLRNCCGVVNTLIEGLLLFRLPEEYPCACRNDSLRCNEEGYLTLGLPELQSILHGSILYCLGFRKFFANLRSIHLTLLNRPIRKHILCNRQFRIIFNRQTGTTIF